MYENSLDDILVQPISTIAILTTGKLAQQNSCMGLHYTHTHTDTPWLPTPSTFIVVAVTSFYILDLNEQ